MHKPKKSAKADNPEAAHKATDGLTIAQEQFCREYIATGGNASEAYRRAYPLAQRWKPETLHPKASRLLAEDKVNARVAALRAEASARANDELVITVEKLTQLHLDAVEMAKALGQPNTVVAASKALAELHGLIVQKVQETSVQYVVSDTSGGPAEDVTAEQWAEEGRHLAAQPRTPRTLS